MTAESASLASRSAVAFPLILQDDLMVSLTAIAPRLGPALAPLSIIVAAIAGLAWVDSHIPRELVSLGPAAAMVLAFVLSIYFKLSNIAIIVLMLSLGMVLVAADPAIMPPAFQDSSARTAVVCILLPLNLFLFSVLPDRGLVTVSGVLRLAFLVLQVGAALLALMTWPWLLEPGGMLAPGHWPPLPASPVPLAGIALFVIAILSILVLAVRRGTPLEVGTAMATIAIMGAVHLQDRPEASAVMIVASGSALVATLLQNGYRLAFVDELTNLPGRRALEMEMKRLAGRYVVAMLDIDHFKKFNDSYGHDVGDEALRMVASNIRQVGGGGKPFRYGGEEFTVLFSGMSLDDALEWLEDLRADVESTPFRVREQGARVKTGSASRRRRSRDRRTKSLTLTISIGAADRSDRHKTPEHVIKAADKALYRAKEKGRNQVSK